MTQEVGDKVEWGLARRRAHPWVGWSAGIAVFFLLSLAVDKGPIAHAGVLFEIQSAPGRAPSFLFGTIHSDDPRVTELPAQVQAAFDASPGFILEVIPDGSAIIKAMVTMAYTDGRRLSDVLPSELYRQASAALAERGMPEEAFRDFKPWAVMTLLSAPPAERGELLDLMLYRAAVEDGKRLEGLETMEEQLAVFDDLALTDQVALLRATLESWDQLPRMLDQLVMAYLARDLDALLELSEAYIAASEPRLASLFWEAVVESRNRRMLERLIPLLDQGGWFVAVGALHLAGDSGIVESLRRHGYRVSSVY